MVFFLVVAVAPETVVALGQGDGLVDVLEVEGGDVLRLIVFEDLEVGSA